MKFDVFAEIERISGFIKDIFDERPSFNGVVIGISGGKDSLVCAALCVKALGADRVLGVLMPDGEQPDINDSLKVVEHLGIKSEVVNIRKSYRGLVEEIGELPAAALQNILPRLRMTALYAIAQERGHLVCCTGNLSESIIGYTTKWGDNVGDFAPIVHITKTEVVEVGAALGLPLDIVHKAPSDGFSGATDEERFGFSYDELDAYIRKGADAVSAEVFAKIMKRIDANQHKRLPIPVVG